MDSKFICLFTFILISNWNEITAQNIQDELIGKNEKIPSSSRNGVVSYRMNKAVVPFIGRKTEIDQLISMFQDPANQYLVITGPAGVGKTEISRKYAEILKESDSSSSQIWIDAESIDSITFYFKELANFIGLDSEGKLTSEIIEDVFNFFKNKKALFIFDGASKIYILNRIHKFISPDNLGTKILVTSRDTEWNESFKKLPLDVFTEEDSVEFLIKNLGLSTENITDAQNVARALQNIPLALSKAAKYIKDHENYTLDNFLLDYAELSETNNIPTSTLDPIEEILRQEEANPKSHGDETSIFEELGVRPVRKLIIIEKVEPPTNEQLRNYVKNKVEKEVRRGRQRTRKFFQRLRNDVFG